MGRNLKFGVAAMLLTLFGTALNAQSITTIFSSNNGGSAGGGVYFDVLTSTNPLDITGLDTNTSATVAVSISVYFKTGTYVGSEATAGAWTLHETVGATGAGTDVPTNITFTNPLSFAASTQYALAIVITGGSHRYSGTGTNPAPGALQYSNADVQLDLGAAGNVAFSGTPFTPRIWNGTLYYNVITSSPPSITSTAPANAFLTQMYTYTVTATGNPAPTFSIAGTLPPGITWDGTDTLSGIPTAVGTYAGIVITATNGVSPDATENITITVSPSAPEIQIDDPNANDVANNSTMTVYAAVAASSSNGTFDVNNPGNVTLNITSFTVGSLVNCTDASSGPGGTIGAGGNDTFTVDVTPTAAGAFSFTVTIVSNDADEGTFVINFTGTAKAATDCEIAVLGPTSASIANGGTVTENNTGTLLFTRNFTVRNEGGATLNLTGAPVVIGGLANCTVTPTQPASSTLGAASTFLPTDEAFSLDITPTAAGAFSFTVTIASNDADEGTFTFTFSGNTATPSGGGGGGGGGDDGGCSTNTTGFAWLVLLAVLSVVVVGVRSRRARA